MVKTKLTKKECFPKLRKGKFELLEQSEIIEHMNKRSRKSRKKMEELGGVF